VNLFIWVLSLVVILSALLVGLGSSLRIKTPLDREKSSPFECGFTPKRLPRMPFSLRFFLICVLFLVFDVELVLIFPAVAVITLGMSSEVSIVLLGFLIILLLGLYHEVNQGSLSWAH